MDFRIEQAVFQRSECGEAALQGRSPGFQDAWLPEAIRLCTGFGLRPAGVRCPACVFAQPLDRRHAAVVQVADREVSDQLQPQGLWFRVMVISRPVYERMVGDPFTVDERFPPESNAGSDLPTLVWPEALPSPQSVADIQEILKRSHGPALLGSVQILVDGGRVVFQRPAPDADLMRGLWKLLPYSSRGFLWPASFAFGNELRFHALVVPEVPTGLEGYISESQAEGYPEGSYELHLQTAAEEANQAELDAVFTHRSARQVWRYGLVLLVIAVLLAAMVQIVLPPPAVPRHPARPNPAGPQGVNRAPKASH